MYKNKNFFESVACAVKGLVKGFKAERNFKIYVVIAVVFLIFNILLKSGIYDYIIYIILACGTFGAEYINTAIERLCDRQCREDDSDIRFVKDVSAAAVLCMGIAFFASQLLILVPKLICLF